MRYCRQTPMYPYKVEGVTVNVKREDLCAPDEDAPPFSKMRGVMKHVESRPETTIGVLDTFHSKAGWAVAFACREFGKRCLNYYPEYTRLRGVIQPQQAKAAELGAELVKLPAGRSAILFHQAKKDLALNPNSYMMPNALKLPESVAENAEEAERTGHWIREQNSSIGTLVISISSGTVASGVLLGLSRADMIPGSVVLHMGYSRSHAETLRYVLGPSQLNSDVVSIVDEGYAYADTAGNLQAPFPCNPYYDLKAWKWLRLNVETLKTPILFWNIGD